MLPPKESAAFHLSFPTPLVVRFAQSRYEVLLPVHLATCPQLCQTLFYMDLIQITKTITEKKFFARFTIRFI